MIRIGDSLSIEESEIEERFIRSPGPGGQNVNKVATAVQLRFDAAGWRHLPEPAFRRLRRIAGRRMTREGTVVITASRHRSQERNREDARARLADLLRAALTPPRRRRATRPTKGSKERRISAKKQRGATKQNRRRPAAQD